jgi:hypothetical protein
MRTTINLPDELMLRAKRAALEAGTTLTEFIADALRVSLAEHPQRKRGRALKINPSGRGGVFPGVDLDDTSALLDIMDGLHDPDRR